MVLPTCGQIRNYTLHKVCGERIYIHYIDCSDDDFNPIVPDGVKINMEPEHFLHGAGVKKRLQGAVENHGRGKGQQVEPVHFSSVMGGPYADQCLYGKIRSDSCSACMRIHLPAAALALLSTEATLASATHSRGWSISNTEEVVGQPLPW